MTRAPRRIPPKGWYRQRPVGNGITWIDERFIQDFYRCNIWPLRGRERDVMVDSGMGVLLSGDIVFDGPLTEDTPHAKADAYIRSMQRRARLPVRIVHSGHFPSVSGERLTEIFPDWLRDTRV
ncbi:hypothetical protein [Alloyangia pacifica]|uniref:hypothetical protein n=1 Tax=Alloyangia pacifica TaxID=311180 RepID=UPI0031D6D054